MSAPAHLDEHAEPAAQRSGRRLALYLVGGLLGLPVAVHAGALVVAFSADTDVVRADYYNHGEAWDAELGALQAGQRFDLQASIEPAPGGWQHGAVVVLSMTDPGPAERPPGGLVQLRRLNDARLDRAWPVATPTVGDGRLSWRLPTATLRPGLWLLRAELLGQTRRLVERRIDVPEPERGP